MSGPPRGNITWETEAVPVAVLRQSDVIVPKPLLLALILFGWLIVGGALINRWVPALLG